MPRGVRADPPEDVVAIVEGLVNRKSEIETRLEELGVTGEAPMTAAKASAVATKRGRQQGTNTNNKADADEELADQPGTSMSDPAAANNAVALIAYTPKTDTHWDFVMKEMMWLGADFQGERKRQVALAKKLASRYAIDAYEHMTGSGQQRGCMSPLFSQLISLTL